MMSGAGQSPDCDVRSGPDMMPLRGQPCPAAPRPGRMPSPAGLAGRIRPLAQPARPAGREKIQRFRERALVMATAIFAAVLGLLIATAAIGIPQLVRIRHQQPDHDDTQAYLTATGRSARDIAQGNAVVRERQQNQARAPAERR